MSLVMECTLTGVGPDLPGLSLGPEPDLLPLLVPRPEAAATEAFLVLPQVARSDGRTLFQLDSPPAPWKDTGNALVFGIRLAPALASHTIAFANNWPQARASVVPLPEPASGQRRFDLGVYRPADGASRLVLGAAGSSGGRSVMHVVEFPEAILTDDSAAPSGSGAGFQTAGAFQLNAWQYQPPDTASSAWIDLNASWPAPAGTPPWLIGSGSCLYALPSGDGIMAIYNNSTDPVQAADRLQLGSLRPWQDATQPQAVAFSSTSLSPLSTTAITGLPSGFLAGAFATWNPYRSGGFLTLTGSQPADSGRYRCYSAWKISGSWQLSGPLATDWPPVRALADGSLLSLRDRQWSRVRFGAGGAILATSDGSVLPTGTLQFLYELSDSDGVWMVFSQAFPVPGSPGRKDSLVLRAWKIREADFLTTAR
jgi:hypothetical protein